MKPIKTVLLPLKEGIKLIESHGELGNFTVDLTKPLNGPLILGVIYEPDQTTAVMINEEMPVNV